MTQRNQAPRWLMLAILTLPSVALAQPMNLPTFPWTEHPFELPTVGEGTGSRAPDIPWEPPEVGQLLPGPCARETDLGADGQVDDLAVFVYDTRKECQTPLRINGCPTSLEVDETMDGTVEYRVFYIYDLANRLVRSGTDRSGDGTIEARIFYTYDERGRVTETLYEFGSASFHYSPDEPEVAATSIEEVLEVDSEEEFTQRFLFLLETDGRPSERHEDHNDDTEPDLFVRYIYDDYGNLLAEEYSRSRGGRVSNRIAYTFDCWPTASDSDGE